VSNAGQQGEGAGGSERSVETWALGDTFGTGLPARKPHWPSNRHRAAPMLIVCSEAADNRDFAGPIAHVGAGAKRDRPYKSNSRCHVWPNGRADRHVQRERCDCMLIKVLALLRCLGQQRRHPCRNNTQHSRSGCTRLRPLVVPSEKAGPEGLEPAALYQGSVERFS